jgi:hypothetical protein
MAVVTIKPKNVVLPFNLKFNFKRKDDKHKKEQEQPVHGAGQDGCDIEAPKTD